MIAFSVFLNLKQNQEHTVYSKEERQINNNQELSTSPREVQEQDNQDQITQINRRFLNQLLNESSINYIQRLLNIVETKFTTEIAKKVRLKKIRTSKIFIILLMPLFSQLKYLNVLMKPENHISHRIIEYMV